MCFSMVFNITVDLEVLHFLGAKIRSIVHYSAMYRNVLAYSNALVNLLQSCSTVYSQQAVTLVGPGGNTFVKPKAYLGLKEFQCCVC